MDRGSVPASWVNCDIVIENPSRPSSPAGYLGSPPESLVQSICMLILDQHLLARLFELRTILRDFDICRLLTQRQLKQAKPFKDMTLSQFPVKIEHCSTLGVNVEFFRPIPGSKVSVLESIHNLSASVCHTRALDQALPHMCCSSVRYILLGVLSRVQNHYIKSFCRAALYTSYR